MVIQNGLKKCYQGYHLKKRMVTLTVVILAHQKPSRNNKISIYSDERERECYHVTIFLCLYVGELKNVFIYFICMILKKTFFFLTHTGLVFFVVTLFFRV